MLLSLDQMKEITRGTARVELREGCFCLRRFTAAQEESYLASGNMDFYRKTFATAGVRLALRTDSRRLDFGFRRLPGGSSRHFADFDLYENGQLTAHLSFDEEQAAENRVHFALSAGEKEVEVYLPFSVHLQLFDVELDDGATLCGLFRKHTMLAFGDSITQGYDARYPSLSYANALARLLDADLINKGIGAEGFCPQLLETKEDAFPDYITVAYGTNDWKHRRLQDIIKCATAFYKRLSESYPDSRIFAVTPIWRLDQDAAELCEIPCTEMDALLRECAAGLPNVTVLRGWSYIPALPQFFSDAYLHPNDIGFALYAQNLYREIKRLL